MRLTKKFAQEHIYIFSLLFSFIALTLLYISNTWFSKSGRLNFDLNGILTYFIPLIFVFGIYLVLGNMSQVKFHKEGIGKAFLLGFPFIVVGLYNFIISYISFGESSFPLPSIQKLVYYSLIMLCIGLFEEILCRGVILNNMLKKWGNTKKGILRVVIISSLIFGLGHVINLIIFPTLIIRTISQILYASLHGILYASIYLRTKNIWALILLHAVYDWMVLATGLLQPVNSTSKAIVDISIVSGLINVLFALPFALYGFFLLRKVWVKDQS